MQCADHLPPLAALRTLHRTRDAVFTVGGTSYLLVYSLSPCLVGTREKDNDIAPRADKNQDLRL